MATRSPARPCQNGKYFSCAITAVSCAVARARSRTVAASHLRLVVGTVDEALSPLRWEVARTGTELLILLTPAAPMNMDAATKVNAMSAIRGCLRILLLLGVSKTRWVPGGCVDAGSPSFACDSRLGAGRAGRIRTLERPYEVQTGLALLSLLSRLLFAPSGEQVGTSNAAHAARLAGAEVISHACGKARDRKSVG